MAEKESCVSLACHVRSFRGSSACVAVMLLASTDMSTTFILQVRLDIYRQWLCMGQESMIAASEKLTIRGLDGSGMWCLELEAFPF